MRQVTQQICTAFLNGEQKTVGNSHTDGWTLKLFGNTIATKDAAGAVFVSFAGYPTATTRERINGLSELMNGTRPFHLRKRTVMKDGTPIDDTVFYYLGR